MSADSNTLEDGTVIALLPQRDGEDAYAYGSRLEREHEKTGELIRAVRGGSFKGRKPNGLWWVQVKVSIRESSFLQTQDALIEGDPRRAPVEPVAAKPPKKPKIPKTEIDILAKDPIELVIRAAAFRCSSCRCLTSEHATRELDDDEKKGLRNKDKPRCGGMHGDKECSCTLTPEEIHENQSNVDWICKQAERRRMDLRNPSPHLRITANNIWDGLRGDKPKLQGKA